MNIYKKTIMPSYCIHPECKKEASFNLESEPLW